jgi:hypothetical protein
MAWCSTTSCASYPVASLHPEFRVSRWPGVPVIVAERKACASVANSGSRNASLETRDYRVESAVKIFCSGTAGISRISRHTGVVSRIVNAGIGCRLKFCNVGYR